jgi:hypothetical protein
VPKPAHLVWAVNIGCLGFHSWPVRASDQEHCDELRIDLDPGPGTNYEMAKETAHVTKGLLDDLGTTGFIKSSGNRGLHVYVRLAPTHDSIAVRSAAVAVARELERRRPDLITASWWKEERGARIFIDFNQNAPHKTVFAPWFVRASTAPVSFLPWSCSTRAQPHDMTIATVPAWVASTAMRGRDERRTAADSCSWRWCPTRRRAADAPGRLCTRRCPASPRAAPAKKPPCQPRSLPHCSFKGGTTAPAQSLRQRLRVGWAQTPSSAARASTRSRSAPMVVLSPWPVCTMV